MLFVAPDWKAVRHNLRLCLFKYADEPSTKFSDWVNRIALAFCIALVCLGAIALGCWLAWLRIEVLAG